MNGINYCSNVNLEGISPAHVIYAFIKFKSCNFTFLYYWQNVSNDLDNTYCIKRANIQCHNGTDVICVAFKIHINAFYKVQKVSIFPGNISFSQWDRSPKASSFRPSAKQLPM